MPRLGGDRLRALEALIRLGHSLTSIERTLGIPRSTIVRHRNRVRAGKTFIPPSQPRDRACASYGSEILTKIARGQNAYAVWQDLVDEHCVTFSYESLKRFVRDHRPPPEVFNRVTTREAEEAQVDYGEGAATYDQRTGTFRIPRLWVLTLSYSRYHFAKVVWESSQRTWCELHEAAFAFIGGTTSLLLLDNLREGVVQPDIYDPQLNELFSEFLLHHKVTALPCRPFFPNGKGKVESAISYVQEHLQGREFPSLEAQNEHLAQWATNWAYEREHGTTKRIVREAFEEERPYLQPLPPDPFDYYVRLARKVHRDTFIEVKDSYYSAPPSYVGQTIDVRLGDRHVQLVNPLTRVVFRKHQRATRKGERILHPDDQPKATPPTVLDLVARAHTLSPTIGHFAAAIKEIREPAAARVLLGLLKLAQQYRISDVEAACRYAHHAGSARLGLLKAWLSRPVAQRAR